MVTESFVKPFRHDCRTDNELIYAQQIRAEKAEEHIRKLEQEIADLQMHLDASCNAEELRQVREDRDRLGDLLMEYGRHSHGCSAEHGDQYRCRCGWREVEAAQAGEES